MPISGLYATPVGFSESVPCLISIVSTLGQAIFISHLTLLQCLYNCSVLSLHFYTTLIPSILYIVGKVTALGFEEARWVPCLYKPMIWLLPLVTFPVFPCLHCSSHIQIWLRPFFSLGLACYFWYMVCSHLKICMADLFRVIQVSSPLVPYYIALFDS